MKAAHMPDAITAHRPGPDTKTRRVWDIADQLTEETGRRAQRAEVVSRFVAEGGNANTASTQYHHWKAWREAARAEEAKALPQSAPGQAPARGLEISREGLLLLPPDIRAAMAAPGGGRVTAEVVDGELRISAPAVSLLKAQRLAQKYRKPGVSVVDEFLEERRRLWGEE